MLWYPITPTPIYPRECVYHCHVYLWSGKKSGEDSWRGCLDLLKGIMVHALSVPGTDKMYTSAQNYTCTAYIGLHTLHTYITSYKYVHTYLHTYTHTHLHPYTHIHTRSADATVHPFIDTFVPDTVYLVDVSTDQFSLPQLRWPDGANLKSKLKNDESKSQIRNDKSNHFVLNHFGFAVLNLDFSWSKSFLI